MAGPNLPENITAGTSGHSGHHNAVHDVVNRFDITEQPAVGEVPMWTGSLYTPQVPPGASGSAGFNTSFGHRYCDYTNGLDANDGASPATAKKTIQAAHDSLPSRGGTVFLSATTHQVTSQINWTRNDSRLIGCGRKSTHILGKTNGMHIIKVTGHHNSFSDFQIGDDSDTSGINGLSSIYIDGADWWNVERVNFDQMGKGLTAVLSFDAGPAHLRIDGTTNFGDWGRVSHCKFRSGYRSMAISSGMNGWVQNCAFYGERQEKVKILKRDRPITEAVEWRFMSCWFIASPGSGFGVHIDWDTADPPLNQAGNISFIDCMTEMSAAGSGFGGYYANLQDVQWNGCMFSMVEATGPAIRCGPTGQLLCGPYASTGSVTFQRQTGGTFTLWQPSNFTGTATLV